MDNPLENQILPPPPAAENIEPPKAKFLLIDDYDTNIELARIIFRGVEDFVAVKCGSVEEAVAAVRANKPKILFLDHGLTFNGNEGFEILDEVRKIDPNIIIYSTTTNGKIAEEYAQKGVEHVDKNDIGRLTKIVAGK